MDQSSLVADLIEDGRRFVERFIADVGSAPHAILLEDIESIQ